MERQALEGSSTMNPRRCEMRKWSCLFLVFILLAFLKVPQAACGEDPIKLKMADSFPIGHISHEAALYFIKRVGELSDNKVKIEYYPSEQLGKLKDYLNLCGEGILDIAYVPPSFYAGQVPLNTALILPFWTHAVEGTTIYNRLVEACPEINQEFLKYRVRPLIINSTSQYDVGTVKKPVRSPEDLKNLKLKTSGGLFDKIARQYGIITVTLAAPEVYEATQRGIVDGNIFSYPSVKGYRVNELQKYHTYGLRMGGYPSSYQINEKKWQKLPKGVQTVLQDAAKDAARYSAENWDKETIRLLEDFEKGGMVIHRVQAQDRPKWETPLKGIEEIWIQEMEKKNLPGRKVFEILKNICQEVVK
jgi:TRAP-type C4-dicarboxylate transport system substrate-binding protein